MKKIDYTKALQALNMLKVETGSLACLGCEYEDHCATNGCSILCDVEKHLMLAMATESFLQCSNCDYWSRNDPRCMCDKSHYAGRTVRPDNCCSCVSVDMLAASEEARSDLARQLAATRKELAEVKAERSWISVKDRLPEKDGEYIVTACDEGCSAGEGIWYDTVVVVAEYFRGSWTWYEGSNEWSLEDIVTHWMPLPEPPEKEA